MPLEETQNSHTITRKAINRGESLFITGKAGTGKTTLLKWLCNKFGDRKTIAIVAPTGVAAKNAGGVTIHSLLHLPLNPYLPGMKIPNLYAVRNDDEIRAIRKIDILIIDEISMVRCDVMDAMDDILRHYRKNDNPFGGIQVVMFGDLYQLMPVIKDDEWEELKKHYASPYFFSSDVYTKLNCTVIELAKIYRQHDSDFINLLNHVRDGVLLPEDKKDLESRYDKNFVPNDSDGYIRLTTHNWMAKSYNNKKLDSLNTPLFEYKAFIEGFFPKPEYPTSYVIQLKRGARVMFVRNDNSGKQYVNGTLGAVVDLNDRYIEVLTDDKKLVQVTRQTWDFDRYKFNKEKNILEIEHCGSFTQYPLRLAWSVTVHKSQGLTFDRVVIDVGRAFTYGQVYVALSRCRHFHGIVLVSDIKSKNIKADPEVKRFLQETERIVVDKPEETDINGIQEPEMSSSMKRTYWAVQEGLTAQEIIIRCDEKKGVIYAHLTKLIESGKADIAQLLPTKTISDIRSVAIRLGKDASQQDIKAKLHTDYPYGEIIMVKASLQDRDYTLALSQSKPTPIVHKPAPIIEQKKPEPQPMVAPQTEPQSVTPAKPHQPTPIDRQHKRWKVNEIKKMIYFLRQGKSFLTIADKIGRTEIAVISKLRELGYIEWNAQKEKYVRINK